MGGASAPGVLTRLGDGKGLSLVGAGRSTPLARDWQVEVPPAMSGLLPEGGLRRGSVVTLQAGEGTGATSLALALAGPSTKAGAWAAAVGLPSLGLVAADQLGAALDRLVLVPHAGPQWAVVAAALAESVELLLVAPPGPVRPADARRLTARARERRVVLVIVTPAGRLTARWPEPADLHLAVSAARWEGLDAGAGHLRGRLVDVVVTGRRGASRPRYGQLWLPGPDGGLAAVEGPAVSSVPLVPAVSLAPAASLAG